MNNYLNTYRRYACDLARINEEAQTDPENLIRMTETVYRHDLRLIVDQIVQIPGHRHVLLLSGPSGSGKTTTAQKLADVFRSRDIDAQLISMDDFYLGADFVQKLPDGRPDFESVEALDIPLIQKSIRLLSTVGECTIPKYDFKHSKRSSQTKDIVLQENSVIIMEGIHALHPIFSQGMEKEKVLKLYVSVKQGIKDGESYVLTNQEIRLLRRLVRDYSFRKVSPEYMISMWPTVVDGEKKYIRPYRYTSDFTVNSIHIYEPCVLKKTALQLCEELLKQSTEAQVAAHLAESLNRFADIDPNLLPEDSLIREFLGGGCYSY